MRRLHWGLLGVGLPLFVLCLTLSGCKRAEVSDSDTDEGFGSGGGSKTAVTRTGIKMGKGVIKGKVAWKGNKPDLPKMDEEMLALINSKPDDKRECLNCGTDEKSQQRFRIGGNNGVGNVAVFVMLADPKTTFFEFSDDDLKSLNLNDKKKCEVDQPHCAFLPHVQVGFMQYVNPKKPKQYLATGQTFKVVNNAKLSHNTKWADTGKIRGGNVLLPPGGFADLPLVPESQPLQIQCSIHNWMDGWIWSLDHPYAAVTKYNEDKPDDPAYGTYEIHNVPTGVKLKIVAWHEVAHFLTKDGKLTGGDEIEVSDKEPLIKDFEMSAK